MNYNGSDQLPKSSPSGPVRSANVQVDSKSLHLPESCSPQKKATLNLMVNLIERTKHVDSSLPHQGLNSNHRSQEFQRLVRRYIIQIRYGCSNQHCTTPTCFGCHKRVYQFPIRRPSVLAARSIAFQLATEDDPYTALCPHTPLASPDDFLHTTESSTELEHVCKPLLDTTELVENEHNARQKMRHASEIMPIDPMDEPKTSPEATEPTEQSGSREEPPETKDPILDYQEIHRSVGYKKDRKSLTQSLFDSRSVKLYEWRTIISPMDILKTPSMNGTAAKDWNSNGHAIPHRNGDEVTKTEQGSRKIVGHDGEEPTKVQSHTESMLVSGHAVSPASGTRSSNEITPEEQDCLTGTIGVAPTHVAIVEQLTGNIIAGLRSLASQAKEGTGFNHTGNYLDHGMPSIHLDAATRPNMLDFVKRTLVYHFADPLHLSELIQYNKSLVANYKFPPALAQHFEIDKHVGMNVASFTNWVPAVGSLLLDSLWQSLGGLFVPPPHIASKCGHDTRSSGAEKAEHIHDTEASDMIYLAILGLVGSGYTLNEKSQETISDLRAWGRTLPNSNQSGRPDPLSDPWVDISDHMEYEPAVRLAKRLVRVIAARRSFWLISQTMPGVSPERHFPVMSIVITYMKNELMLDRMSAKRPGPRSSGVPFYLLEWLRTIILKTWDGEVTVKRWEDTGAAIELISDLFHARRELSLPEAKFQTPFLSNHLTDAKIPEYFALPRSDKNTLNILDYSYLFVSQIRVSYFRTLNFASMSEAYQSATFTEQLKEKMLKHAGREEFGRNIGRWDRTAFLDSNLKAALAKYLVLDVRRDHLLEDAFNQLWGLEKRELLRPLKVRMGMGEGGEEGVDHGGVSQEFFRLVFEQAFDPEAGLFVTTDPQVNMTWFQPLSLEPLQTYQLLGLLVGLAVYNGITVPMSFPQALYRKLLGIQEQRIIDDGWPMLKKSLLEMENWKEGDVADVFVREFAFSCTANGENYTADMKCSGENAEFPRCAFVLANEAPDIPLVTNNDRIPFRKMYIRWLLDLSIRPQYEAFSKGFFTIISERSLQLLSPALLKNLAEGYQVFDIKGLYKSARYEDGYSRDSQVIKWFWAIVFRFDDGDKKRLLEFVTASDRIPVQGWLGLSFSIVRNGGDTERIPTSMTCFGKLLLPEYSSFDKLKRKLEIALENSKGFGSA